MWNSVRAVIHLDMDAYYASVEQQSNPLLSGKPIIVTGKGSRTVIVTASYEAREYGIKAGMTISEAKALCPYAVRVVGNLEKYLYTTLRIREALLRFTDRVELYSIDEFFLDVTCSQPIFGPPEAIVEKIKSEVWKATGLSCSCGLAPNKLLAKLASEMNKPDGLTIIYPEKITDILKDLPVDKLHGIGRKTRDYLSYLGITRASELGDAPIDLLTAHFGIGGHILKFMGRGIDNSPVPYYWEQDRIKSIGHSYTLPYDTSDVELIKSYILMLCQKVNTRLRKEGKCAQTVALTIRYNDYRIFSRRKTVGYSFDTIHAIYHVCLKILGDMGDLPKPVRLLGVSVTSLSDRVKQLYLLQNLEREEEINEAIEKINSKFGEFTIKPASILHAEEFERLHGNAHLARASQKYKNYYNNLGMVHD